MTSKTRISRSPGASSGRRAGKIKNFDYGFLLALIIPIFAVMPLLTHAGLPNSADGPVHLMRQVELNEAWQQGNLYPRWGTDLALGHGMPIFSYAPPLLYQATQIIHLTGLPLDEAMKGVLVGTFLLCSLGMFLFVRPILGPYPALLAAAVYVYAPYRLREAYIQGNYGQFLGLAFYPLIFWAFYGLITDGRPRYVVAAALSLAGLLFSHNISAMLFLPVFAAYLLFLLIATCRQMSLKMCGPVLLRTAAGALLGLGLSAVFWLPAFGERHEIKLEGITRGFFDFRENFVSLPEFFSPPRPLDLAAINPEFPLSLGLPQIFWTGLAIVGLILTTTHYLFLRAKSTNTSSLASARPSVCNFSLYNSFFFALFLLLYAYLALPYSQRLWESVPLIELAEFPWRMLGPAIFCTSFLAAAAFAFLADQLGGRRPVTVDEERSAHHAGTSLHRAPGPASYIFRSTHYTPRLAFQAPSTTSLLLLAAIFATIALNAYYLYPSQFISWGTPTPADAFAYEAISGAIGTTSTGEFLPRAAQQHPQADSLWPDYAAGRPPQRLDPATLPAGATVDTVSHLAESEVLQIDAPHAFQATLRLLYWPGWQLFLDGQPLPFRVAPATGLMQADIPAGRHMLTLRLESTPLRTAGQWLTLASIVVVLSFGIMAIYPKKNEAGARPESAFSHPPAAPATAAISGILFSLTAGLLVLTYLLSRPLAPLFVLQSDPNRPQAADRQLHIDFGDQLRLVGRDNLPEKVQVNSTEGGDLYPVLYWRAQQELDTNYSVFVHLDAPNGQTAVTVDEVHPENIPTRNWPPGLYLRNPLHLKIAAGTPPIRYDINVGVYNRETGARVPIAGSDRADTFTLASVWLVSPEPPLPSETVAHFGPYITLRHVSLDDEDLTLYWEASQPLDPNQTIYVHLLGSQGKLLGQVDGAPYGGMYPLHSWLPNHVVTDSRDFGSHLDDKSELTAIAIGIYNLMTGDRLPATDGAGNSLPQNNLVLPVMP